MGGILPGTDRARGPLCGPGSKVRRGGRSREPWKSWLGPSMPQPRICPEAGAHQSPGDGFVGPGGGAVGAAG